MGPTGFHGPAGRGRDTLLHLAQQQFRGAAVFAADDQTVVGQNQHLRFRLVANRALHGVRQGQARGHVGNPFPRDAIEQARQTERSVFPHRPGDGGDRVHVENDPMGQHGVHGGFDGSA